ncbi:hypothetical protein KFE25_009083 [Diacronema lutheri]|uniref:SRCR domain-containing protein n=1 Tax=Diacronema lutheri TaxID=2081491 RepID=A0A8J6CD70_DIALT|nr:hypothetical protein KFE25_009083 [Diacronema lutheri]
MFRLAAIVGATLCAVACAACFLVATPANVRPSALSDSACSIVHWAPSIHCSKDQESAACCRGLRTTFNAGCACKRMPAVVLSHGGDPLWTLDNMLRCGFSEGVDANGDPMAPVEFVTEAQGCADRKEWCNDKLHNIDVRLSIGNKGLVQLHDAVKGWVYVHTDDANMAATASSACRAMGYERHVGVHIDPLIHASKRLNCPRPDTRISECAVEELPTLRTGALYADCGSGGYRAELCVRVGQRSRTSNNLS